MHPELLLLIGISFSMGFTPGPNNAVASYSAFNFGVRKTLPIILGVGLGYTVLVILLILVLISVQKNEKARKPSLVIRVDFGDEIGIKQSSAQITQSYNEENLKGKQVIGVCNFPEKNIAGVISQVLILGSIDKDGKVILVHPSQKSENGLPIA